MKGERLKRRHLRILPREGGYYVHVTSRVVDRRYIFGEREKGVFVGMARKWAGFSGVGMVTHCVMSNHFHLLLWVPVVRELEVGEVVERLRLVWPEEKVAEWERVYGMMRSEAEKEAFVKRVTDRMHDLPEMMRVLKHGFSTWYNRTNERTGALWEDRYASVVVEETPWALLTVAAYIDLNPVRGGLVEDPAEYGASGYGSACGGDELSRQGLRHLVADRMEGFVPVEVDRRRSDSPEGLDGGALDWREARQQRLAERWASLQRMKSEDCWPEIQRVYRCWLYTKGLSQAENPRVSKKTRQKKGRGFTRADLERVYAEQGAVPWAEELRKARRSMTRGVALGGEGFLEALFRVHRACFGPDRKRGTKEMKQGWGGMGVLRQVD
jgi:putative transposase